MQRLNDVDHGARLLVTAASVGNIMGISTEEVTSWGKRCIEAGKPTLAVEIGIASWDAGTEVPVEQIQEWLAVCYDDKPADVALNNAISLMEIFRKQLGYGTEIDSEIETAYEKVMEHWGAMGLTAATPYREAMEKISTILSAGVRTNSS
jgi:hypothetical protein